MKEFYWEPPVFTVDTTVEKDNFVIVTGQITLKSKDGADTHYDYCDVWKFENGKMAGVKAYVIEKKITLAFSFLKNIDVFLLKTLILLLFSFLLTGF